METIYGLLTGSAEEREEALARAGEILRDGGLVAFPTETVYGLGGNALSAAAAEKIYAAKGRPSDNPLIVHIARFEEMEPLVREIPESAEKLAAAFWPGPLTMILPKSEVVPRETSGGLDTVAIRLPLDPNARALIQAAGLPIAAPSANTSGRPSPTSARHVAEDLGGKIDMILDGGAVAVGLESTIVDLTGSVPALLRPGAITPEMLEGVLGKIEFDPVLTKPLTPDMHPKAPGMKYRHYAPRAEMFLVDGTQAAVIRKINACAAVAKADGKKVGILASAENVDAYRADAVLCLGERAKPAEIAHNLFAALREMDARAVDVIYAEAFPESGVGLAVMNRMNKAAGHHYLHAEEEK